MIDGDVYNQSDKVQGGNTPISSDMLWSMEVDLRSEEEAERTLHWFVDGKQEDVFIVGVPSRVEFCVCYYSLFFFSSIIILFIHYSLLSLYSFR